MSNYYGQSRTNYFKVKDEEAFRKWATEERQCRVIVNQEDPTLLGLVSETEDGDWLATVWDDDRDEPLEIDFVDELSKHLADNEVAVLIHVGSEKLAYLCGFAQAVNHQGLRATVHTDDIYRQAKLLGNYRKPAQG